MRIAMVAPIVEAIPPARYGGTERVVSILTEELVRRGHHVTLFASGDSETAATLEPCCPRALNLDPAVRDYFACILAQIDHVYRRADEFDLVHNHQGFVAFPNARTVSTPTLTTTHGRLDLSEVQRVYGCFPEQLLVSVSADQRTWLPRARWFATVYNGIDLTKYRFRPDRGDYLAFLGRVCPEKGPDRAIRIAREVGMRLVIAGKVYPTDQAYYDQAIAPMVASDPRIDYVGEVDDAGKDQLLGGAFAYLFPIDWPEPFGLTMAEAMATGTPVVASRGGSVPEVVRDGVTGFVCDSPSDMVAAIARVSELDRQACRERVEQRFSTAAMVDGYEAAYAALLAEKQA